MLCSSIVLIPKKFLHVLADMSLSELGEITNFVVNNSPNVRTM